MKIGIAYLLVCFSIVGMVWANDSPIVFTSKEFRLTSESRVQLVKEDIVIRAYSYKELEELRFKADYESTLYFENISDHLVTVQTVFPFEQFYSDEIVNYQILVNQHEIPFTKHEQHQTSHEKYSAMFLSHIAFQPHTLTEVKHTYSLISQDYGAPILILEYVFSTGKNWRETQTQCDVVLLLEHDMLVSLSLIEPAGFQVTKNRIEWHFDHLPEHDLYLEFYDDMRRGMGYSLAVDSNDHELLPHNAQGGYDLSKLEQLLQRPDMSPPLRNFILYLLGANYLSDYPGKAIPYMKQLAEFTEYTDYYVLRDLIECLVSQGDMTSAQPYLQVLANQKEKPGFSLYAQLILQEHHLLNAPLDVEFPKQQTFFEWYDEVILHKGQLSRRPFVLWGVLFLIVFVISIGSYCIWKAGRSIRWKKKSEYS